MTPFEWISSAGSSATAFAALVAVWQLWENRKQARTQFEDSLSKEYRNLIQSIPTEALLGETLTDEEFAAAHDDLYRYIDLSNEQIFLRKKSRVSKYAWVNWADGMKTNLDLPAFSRAWSEIKERAPDSFSELRQLETTNFRGDPASWR